MYSVYIKHFIVPSDWVGAGTLNEEECLMCEFPAEYPGEETLIGPKVKNEMGKAGSFEFSMEMGNPFYGSLLQMTTLMRVEYDGDTIFYGRVLAIDTDMWGKKKVHCEGALAFLLDTLIMPTKEEEREKITLEQHIVNLITSHNGLVTDEPAKRFFLGQVPGYYTSDIPAVMRPVGEMRKYGAGSWTSTLNCLEDLTSKYGGYWRVRYGNYIDRIGQWGKGNINLNIRTVVHNPDGSIDTERPININSNKQEVLIPTIINGRVVTNEQAIAYYETTGEFLGKFETPAESEWYAYDLKERQDWYYNGQPTKKVLFLDWLLNMFDPNVNNQPLRLTENIIDMNNTVDVNGIFTVLIPEGSKNGKSLYLDDIPKSIVNGRREKKGDKTPIGPGFNDLIGGLDNGSGLGDLTP